MQSRLRRWVETDRIYYLNSYVVEADMRHWAVFAFAVFIFPFLATAQTPSFGIDSGNCTIEKQMADHARGRLDNDLQKDFHDILMVNELSGGCGSLQFTD